MANVIVIGGGPAGMMAAITAAEYGNNVTIIEKNSDFGKKLLITGKGRCNITSSLYMSEFIKNTPGNGQFLYSAFQNFTNEDIIIRSLKQPSCTRADIVNGKIEYTIQKELGIEIVGDVKVKIAYDEEEDPWEVIMDDDSNEDIQNAEEQIDQEVNEEYLD